MIKPDVTVYDASQKVELKIDPFSWLVLILWLLSCASFIERIQILNFLIYVIAVTTFFLFYSFVKISTYLSLLFICFFSWSSLRLIYYQEFSLSFITIFLNIGVVVVLIETSINLSIIKIIVGSVLSSLFVFVLLGISIENLISAYSPNHVSTMLLTLVGLYYLESAKRSVKPNILIALIIFYLALQAGGRAGIGATAILLMFSIGSYFHKSTRYVIFTIFIIGILIYWRLLLDFILQLQTLERFVDFGVSSLPRLLILQQWISDFSLEKVLIGYPPNYPQESLGLSIHISWLDIINKMGFFGVLFIIWLFYKSIYIFIHGDMVVSGFIFAFLFRSSFDNIFLTFGVLGSAVVIALIIVEDKNIARRRIEMDKKCSREN